MSDSTQISIEKLSMLRVLMLLELGSVLTIKRLNMEQLQNQLLDNAYYKYDILQKQLQRFAVDLNWLIVQSTSSQQLDDLIASFSKTTDICRRLTLEFHRQFSENLTQLEGRKFLHEAQTSAEMSGDPDFDSFNTLL